MNQYSSKPTDCLFVDIETIPAGPEAHKTLRMLHRKKNRGIRDFEDYLLQTSFDGTYGRILCIGYAMNDELVDILYAENDEKTMLEQFWSLADKAQLFIGHNIIDFDMRFIYQRSMVAGIKPTKNLSFARYRSEPMFDTMREWNKWGQGGVSLEHIALALGLPSPKDGIDGSRVWDEYQKGSVEKILEYCKRDVETTRAVYRRMTFQPPLPVHGSFGF